MYLIYIIPTNDDHGEDDGLGACLLELQDQGHVVAHLNGKNFVGTPNPDEVLSIAKNFNVDVVVESF